VDQFGHVPLFLPHTLDHGRLLPSGSCNPETERSSWTQEICCNLGISGEEIFIYNFQFFATENIK